MRPLKLTMTAFGPYADKTVIEMDKLGENGLYLITGDTGAGKTTIFDAIVFALYGDASGDAREPSMFRSKYAADSVATSVEMTFLYDRKIYIVKRSPEYKRPKKTGADKGKEVKQAASAEFIYPDGRVITKPKEVNDAIKELLGIDRGQFMQIVMIAQGDFRKLLFASTEERRKIFQKLFKTNLFDALQEKLKDESRKLKYACEEGLRAENQYIEGVHCPLSLAEEWSKAKRGELPTSEVLSLLERMLETDKTELTALSSEIETLEEKQAAVKLILENAKKYSETQMALTHEKQALAAENQRSEMLREVLALAQARAAEIETLDGKIADIKAELPRYGELAVLRSACVRLETEWKATEQSLMRNTRLLQEETQKLASLETEEERLKDAGAQKERLLRDQTEKENGIRALIRPESLYEEYGTLTLKLQKAQTLYLSACAAYDKAQRDYEMKNKAFMDAQAGILAQTLTEGEPCPVCGSRSHPAPAAGAENAPTEAQLEEALKKYKAAEKARGDASNICASLKGEKDKTKASLESACLEVFGAASIEDIPEKIKTRRTALQNAIAVIRTAVLAEEKNLRRKEELEQMLPLLKQKAEMLKNTIAEQTAETAASLAQIKEKRAQTEALAGELRFADRRAAEACAKEYEDQKTAFKQALKKAEDNCNESEKRLAAMGARIETLTKTLSDMPETDVSAVQAEADALALKKFQTVRNKDAVIGRLTPNEKTLAALRKNGEEQDKLEKQYAWVKSLSDTANGTMAGQEKIQLETYIQQTYFERILSRANRRLLVMTDGQYELKRRDKTESKSGQSGLDLNIIDHYNGTERDVKTLSGGESFKASLALALGLSDEIQASAGGIQLDTMFVDEGFGSLDEGSLDHAMRALTGLTEGGRLVGIISHVGALKEKIDTQIIVKKDRDGGSRISIRLD